MGHFWTQFMRGQDKKQETTGQKRNGTGQIIGPKGQNKRHSTGHDRRKGGEEKGQNEKSVQGQQEKGKERTGQARTGKDSLETKVK